MTHLQTHTTPSGKVVNIGDNFYSTSKTNTVYTVTEITQEDRTIHCHPDFVIPVEYTLRNKRGAKHIIQAYHLDYVWNNVPWYTTDRDLAIDIWKKNVSLNIEKTKKKYEKLLLELEQVNSF